MSTKTLDYWAGVLQERMGPVQTISNDKYFQRGLARMQEESEQLLIQHHDGKVTALTGTRIGKSKLKSQKTEPAQKYVLEFFRDHADFFGLEKEQITAQNLKVENVLFNGYTVVKIQQYHLGFQLFDARFTMIFQPAGELGFLSGCPFPMSDLPKELKAEVSEKEAVEVARGAVAKGKSEPVAKYFEPEYIEAQLDVGLVAGSGVLVYRVLIGSARYLSALMEVLVNALTGDYDMTSDACQAYKTMIPVRASNHANGRLDVNAGYQIYGLIIDAYERRNQFSGDLEYQFSLQALENGGIRTWNHRMETDKFDRTRTGFGSDDTTDLFTLEPDSGNDINNVFNEQQAFMWGETLRFRMYSWGHRTPGVSAGSQLTRYPVRSGRDRTVEVVLNVRDEYEETLCGVPVRHGCFVSNLSDSWFSGANHPEGSYPAVVMFSNPQSTGSRHFHGPQQTPDYWILTHELGHFYSWQYGGWIGSNAERAGTLNEGHSNALAALFAKSFAPHARNISTTANNDFWDALNPELTLEDYQVVGCTSANKYEEARPFVQMMWRLANNYGIDGDPIWASDEDAMFNAQDLFMMSMFTMTDDSSISWDKYGMFFWYVMTSRKNNGIAQGYRGDDQSIAQVTACALEHGLFAPC